MPVNIKDLWVGERVWIISLRQRGTYRGVHGSGVARIRVGDQELRVNGKDLEVIPESEEKEEDPFLLELQLEQKKESPQWLNFQRTLDLHLEALTPSLTHAAPSRALRYQISQARNFIDQAIRLRVPSIVIIHGKGMGTLRLEIEHLLGDFPEVNHYHAVNEEGAMEIWFRYN
ncbi:MAG: Smr/MutS family protein [Saprospiraceae bacterium]|nr:Smr/MutS family protein [Saprospiraceae bacterium]